MPHLVADPNPRVRLIAAGSLLAAEPGNADAGAVLVEALGDPALRVRKAALELVESLGSQRRQFLEGLKNPTRPESDSIELPRRGTIRAPHNLRSSKTDLTRISKHCA